MRYALGTKLSAEKTGTAYVSDITPENKAAWKRMLKDTAKLVLAPIVHSGDYNHEAVGGALARISAYALNQAGAMYHEALHAFFAQMGDMGLHSVQRVLVKAADSVYVRNQMREFFKNKPEVLAQIENSAEERVAYMFQMYALGELKNLKGEPKNIIEHIAEAIRKFLGIWSNSQRAEHILEYFLSGEYAEKGMGKRNAVAQVLLERGTNSTVDAVTNALQPLTNVFERMVLSGDQRLRKTGIASLIELADKVKTRYTSQHSDTGYLPAWRAKYTQLVNDIYMKMEDMGLGQEQYEDVMLHLQRGSNTNGVVGEAVKAIRQWQTDIRAYEEQSGVKVGDLGGTYFTRIWDIDLISKDPDGFRAMLQSYKDSGNKVDPDAVIARLLSHDGVASSDELIRPGNQFAKERTLHFISNEDAEPWLNKNLLQTLSRYAVQAARSAEFAKRFGRWGDDGGLNILTAAEKEGATAEHIELARQHLAAAGGTLGDNINPKLRRFFGNATVYQNIRLLPFVVFNSLVDPVGMVIRGGEWKDAAKALGRFITHIPKGLSGKMGDDFHTRMAADIGAIEHAAMLHAMGTTYNQGMTSNLGRKINDTFFRYNLMESHTHAMRVAATESAARFLLRHMEDPNEHTSRYLAELGLKASDIKRTEDGNLAYRAKDGLTVAQEARIKAALNKWVDGAILRPDAADKAIWMSDPHFMLIAQMKSFTFSFQNTILKRVVHEFQNGNYRPVMALASYVPFVIASEILKGMLAGGGELPEYQQQFGLADWGQHGLYKAGLFGVGQFGIDAYDRGLGTLTGPAVGQLVDAANVIGGDGQFDKFFISSMPANAVYKRLEPAKFFR